MDELLSGVEHRFWVCHLYNNFRKKFLRKKLKGIIWKAAKLTCPQAWEREMREMKSVNQEAFKDMMKTPHRFWRKFKFKINSKCDCLLNNMLEALDNVLLKQVLSQ